MINELAWYKNYKLALKYYQEHGHLMIIQKYSCLDDNEKEVNLGMWIAHQRQYFKNGLLDKEHIDLLSRIGMVWRLEDVQITEKWLEMYELAKEYYRLHEDLLVPSRYQCSDFDGKIANLGQWIRTQRKTYNAVNNCRLSDLQIRLLNDIDMVWNIKSINTKKNIANKTDNKKDDNYILSIWLKKYKLAKQYYEEHGNLLIPKRYVCIDEDGKEVNLGTWIICQRQVFKGNRNYIMNEKQVEMLNEIGMVWELEDIQIKPNWLKKYELAKQYFEKYGNLLMPYKYVCKDADGIDVNLGTWISSQRSAFKENDNHSLNEKQIEMLNEIGMVWDLEDVQIKPNWLKKYELAKQYYEEYGDLLIPSSYICIDEEGKQVNLGNWINIQRRSLKENDSHSINEKQIEMLNEIGMVWVIRNNKDSVKYNDDCYPQKKVPVKTLGSKPSSNK